MENGFTQAQCEEFCTCNDNDLQIRSLDVVVTVDHCTEFCECSDNPFELRSIDTGTQETCDMNCGCLSSPLRTVVADSGALGQDHCNAFCQCAALIMNSLEQTVGQVIILN